MTRRTTTTCRRRRRTRRGRTAARHSAAALADHCAHGRAAALRLALRASRDAVNGRDRRGRTPLTPPPRAGTPAASRRCSARVPTCIRATASWRRRCTRARRARAAAPPSVRARVVPRDAGQGRSAVDQIKATAARPALRRGARRQAGASTSIVRALVAGASPLVCDAHGRSALAAAAGGGRATLVVKEAQGAAPTVRASWSWARSREAARAGDAKTLAGSAEPLLDIDARK